MSFSEMKLEDLSFNPFTKISKEWFLITAGDAKKSNTMTAAWGGMGFIWNKNVVTIYIRPQRYTKEFVDKNEFFTLSFLPEAYRKAIAVCGRISGRDVADKWSEAGLHPYYVDGTTAVEEANWVLICKKLYQQDMEPECFTDVEQASLHYPDKDYHTLYVAEIVKCLRKD